MKILYAIQGTGNGHLSRARDVIPAILKKKVELDILISGTQADIRLQHPVRYQCQGLSFFFNNKGGINMWRTYLKANSLRLQKEIRSIPVEDYDLIINDFEPVTAWACKLNKKPCLGFSHQAAVLSPKTPKPKKEDPMGKLILRRYAPVSQKFGLHFKSYDENIYTPIIRKDIRNASVERGGHYTVYLPAYSDGKIINVLSRFKNVKWHVFSKYSSKELSYGTVSVRPITNEAFVYSMARSNGVLCGGGFETPAEALYMGKKLMVIPMKGQYEQQCNTAALKEIGVPVLKSLKEKHLDKIHNWIESDLQIDVDYPDITDTIIDRLLQEVVLT